MKEEVSNIEKLTTTDIKKHAVKSVKWTALSEITSRSIQPIVTLILARLLTPADFGIVGIAMIAIGLAQIFQDFGLGKTLIQRETEVEKSANVIFWINITLSVIIYFILFLTAPLISKFFNEPKVVDVLRVLCLQIVLLSLISVHQALFQRNFQFKQLFFIRLLSTGVPGLVSIPLAMYGYGVWSLVAGTLTGTVVQVLLFWKASPWRPRLDFDFQLAKQLYSFGSWVTAEAFLGWLIMWGDSIVLGHFLGVKELGVYRVGVTFLMLVFGIFFNPILPVAYSAFSRLQTKPEELRQSFLKMTKLIASIALPLGVGLAVLSPFISSAIFGQKWYGIEKVIAIIGIMHAIAWLAGHNPEVYRAIGRPDVNTKLLIAAVIYYIPVYILAAPYGLLVFCIARLAIAIVGMGLHIFVANRLLNLPFTYLWEPIKVPLIGSLFLVIVIYPVINLMSSSNGLEVLAIRIGTIIVGVFIYVLILRVLDRELVEQFLRLAKEGFR